MESTIKYVSYLTRNLDFVSTYILISEIYKSHHDWCIFLYLINKILDVFQTQAINFRLRIMEQTKRHIPTRRKIKASPISILQSRFNKLDWTTPRIHYCKIQQILSLRHTNTKLHCRAISQSLNNFPYAHTNCNTPSRPKNKLVQHSLIVAQPSLFRRQPQRYLIRPIATWAAFLPERSIPPKMAPILGDPKAAFAVIPATIKPG